MFGFLGEKLIPSISTSLSASYYFHQKNKSKKSLYILDLTLFITITFIMILYKPFLTFLISRGILSNRFFTYMDNTAVGGRMIRTFFWILVSVLVCI